MDVLSTNNDSVFEHYEEDLLIDQKEMRRNYCRNWKEKRLKSVRMTNYRDCIHTLAKGLPDEGVLDLAENREWKSVEGFFRVFTLTMEEAWWIKGECRVATATTNTTKKNDSNCMDTILEAYGSDSDELYGRRKACGGENCDWTKTTKQIARWDKSCKWLDNSNRLSEDCRWLDRHGMTTDKVERMEAYCMDEEKGRHVSLKKRSSNVDNDENNKIMHFYEDERDCFHFYNNNIKAWIDEKANTQWQRLYSKLLLLHQMLIMILRIT